MNSIVPPQVSTPEIPSEEIAPQMPQPPPPLIPGDEGTSSGLDTQPDALSPADFQPPSEFVR
jgi:hypothetical protein